jgi:hypothetical protein
MKKKGKSEIVKFFSTKNQRLQMSDLPSSIISVLSIFLPLFSKPTYQKFLFLFHSHILCNGRRTVTALIKRMGLRNIKNYSKYHDFFRINKWSNLKGSKILFITLISLIPKNAAINIAIDTTMERRKGPKIQSLNIQRDAVRSTKKRKVLVPGLLWLVCTVQIKLPWSDKVWALPFLSILLPPKVPLSSSKNRKDIKTKIRKHKTLNDWTCQVVKLIRRWAGNSRRITIIGDSAFATYNLANTCCDNNVSLVSRMRIDARIFEFPVANKKGRKNLVGKRMSLFSVMLKDASLIWEKDKIIWYNNEIRTIEYITGTSLWYAYGNRPVPIMWILIRDPKGNLEPVVLFTTNLESQSKEIITEFINRWPIETTFEEVRRHLGMETQRQWSDKAIERETPCILASFSIINLIALELQKINDDTIHVQVSSWYKKKHVTFSDVLAYVRRHILEETYNTQFVQDVDLGKKMLEEFINQMVAA